MSRIKHYWNLSNEPTAITAPISDNISTVVIEVKEGRLDRALEMAKEIELNNNKLLHEVNHICKNYYNTKEYKVYLKENAHKALNIWAYKVKKNNSFKCLSCQADNQMLHAHHVLNRKQHPDLQYELSNGVSFCKACHFRFHVKYGKWNNSMAQVEEFILA